MIERYTPKTIVDTYEKTKNVLCSESGTVNNINTSSTLTKIIQETGRFCESYASDMFITWKSVEALYENRKDIIEPEIYYETFAIRRYGVDGNGFLLARLKGTRKSPYDYVYAEQIYRRILGLKITIQPSDTKNSKPDVKMELKDLTDAFSKIDPEDED